MRSTYEAAWAGAETLKRHCHHIIQTLGPATPPEVFLYRGNAYYALGFPYLALADYENASRFLSLSSLRHQEKCWKALEHFPPKQEVLYPGTNSHLHLCVIPFLDAKSSVQTMVAQEAGKTPSAPSKDALFALCDPSLQSRKVVAVESYPSAGMPVMKVVPSSNPLHHQPYRMYAAPSYEVGGPWLQYPLYERHCSRCGVPLYKEGEGRREEEENGKVRGSTTSSSSNNNNNDNNRSKPQRHMKSEGEGCSSTRTCSTSSSLISSTGPSTQDRQTKRIFPCTNPKCCEEYCSRDCRQLALQEYHSHVCTNEAVQGIEIDLFSRMQQTEEVLEHRELATMLLTLRVLYAALSSQSSPTALPQMRILSGKASLSPRVLCGPMREEWDRIADALHVLTSISYEEFIGVYARVWCNAHWVAEEDEGEKARLVESTASTPSPSCESASYKAIQLHLPYAMFNHSCNPNVVEGVVMHPRHGVSPTGNASASDTPAALNKSLECFPIRTLMTARPVEKGEELTRSYFPLSWLSLPYTERSAAMRSLDFHCQCPRCLKKE